jgi:hypothetical protein
MTSLYKKIKAFFCRSKTTVKHNVTESAQTYSESQTLIEDTIEENSSTESTESSFHSLFISNCEHGDGLTHYIKKCRTN